MSLFKDVCYGFKTVSFTTLALCCITSCSFNHNQTKRKLLSVSKLLYSSPFNRNIIIQNFDLAGKKSTIMNGGIRSNMMLFVESWIVSDGFKISGVKYKYVGPLDLDPIYLESLQGEVQTEFDRVYIESNNNKIIFDTS